MKLVFATTNHHKAKEVAALLAPSGVQVVGLGEFESQPPVPEEDADTFAGNARIKALAYAQALRLPCLADDSGLEVDALGGGPGVRSARYAGVGKTRQERDQANRAKLLAELRQLHEPALEARLVCSLCLASPEGKVLFEGCGTLEGKIAFEAKGEYGFGYDVHLLLPGEGVHAAELPPSQMNERSHRGAAVRKLAAWLEQNPL